MGSQCFTKCESRTIVSSHHKAIQATPLLATATREKQHKNGHGVSLHIKTSPPFGLDRRALLSFLVACLSWSSLFIAVSASETHGDRPTLLLAADDVAWKGSSLLLDQRPPPIVPLLMPPLHDSKNATTTLSAPRSKRSAATDPDFTIPTPFDTGLSNNFTSTCGNFLTRLRASDAFNNCHPFSLLLQTSSGFFDASKSFLRITQTLDATCGVNATQCRTTLDNYARELYSATACKTDYDNDNPLVVEAYNGLVAYQPAYQASCLRDNGGSYCFANAVTNLSSPTDSLPYYLTVGQELPGGSRPTCNSCLQGVMSAFSQYSNNVSQPLSKTYTSAAQQISISCGKTFVNVNAAPLKGAAATTNASFTPTITLILMLLFYLFQ